MGSKVKFVLLSGLLGSILYFVASILLSAIILAITGEGPHGYGVFLYLVLPLYLTPIGLMGSVVTALFLKDLKFKKVLISLGIIFAVVVGGSILALKIYQQTNV